MTDYGEEFEENHGNMHIHRRERRYNGHKLAVAVGHNKLLRAQSEVAKLKSKKTGVV